MTFRSTRIWLPCLNVLFASALLLLGHAQNQEHQVALRQGNVLVEFDYLPSAFQWLAALYAPSGLLTFPLAAIPGIPRSILAVWFLLCTAALWYWLALQIEANRKPESETSSRNSLKVQFLNGLGALLAVLLCFVSGSAALRGAWPLLVDAAGLLWGVGLSTLFLRNILRGRRGREPLVPSKSA
jgi:hypothetical protein